MKYCSPNIPRIQPLLLFNFVMALACTVASWAQPAAVAESTSLDVARGDLDGKRVVFLGDSITAAGTHIGHMETILRRRFPKQEFDFISVGLGSETASGLTEPDHPFPRPCVHERLERVLERAKADIVFACYGMNDGIYHPNSEERTKAYHDGISRLVEKCKKSGARVVLVTPPAFDAKSARGTVSKDADLFGYKTPYENYSEVLAGYSKWIVARNDVTSIDVQTPMMAWLEKRREREPDFRSGDGVHPNAVGYMALALATLDGMGIKSDYATPQAALDHVTKDPAYAAVEKRRSERGKSWMRHTGYIRGPKNQQPEPLGTIEEDAAKSLKSIIAIIDG